MFFLSLAWYWLMNLAKRGEREARMAYSLNWRAFSFLSVFYILL